MESKLSQTAATRARATGTLLAHGLRKGPFRDPLATFVAAYFVLITAATLATGSWLSSDQFVIIGILLLIAVTRSLAVVRDWAPFGLLLLGYEYLRGLAPSLGMKVNIFPMIDADRAFFGILPTVRLQRWLYDPGAPDLIDYAATLLYLMHFVVPVGFAFLLYLRRRQDFRRFAVAMVALSYLAFFTYVLYPAMPPWMAAEQGFIPPVHNVFEETLATIAEGPAVPSAVGFIRSNPVAAMPSLHAAYPTMVFLFALLVFGRRARAFIFYPAAVWFAIVYTGHHYVVDAVIGVAYAVLTFHAVEWVFAWRRKRASAPKRITSREFRTSRT
ncbi:MAG: phosphatase PAP2 family protein [Thermoleophilia bacterium]